LDSWDRFRLDVVDRVFTEFGAKSGRPPRDPHVYVWAMVVGGIPRVVHYAPETGTPGIRADHLELIARRLFGEEAAPRVLARIREAGGLILDL
jgi:hypothetical protein